MADVSWIKIMVDMFDNPKIKYIRKLPEGNNIVLIWAMLLTMAGKCNAGGMIFLTENIPYDETMLANELDFEVNTVRLRLEALEKLNMISRAPGLFINNWGEYQNLDGMERIKEQQRLRSQRYRDKQKALKQPSYDRHMTVIENHATDIEEDKDKDIDKDKIKSKSNKFVAPTLDEVTAYCNERHNNVDANRFIDYYTSNGWMVGKNKMKDWKAAVRNWERGNSNTSSSGSSGGDKFMQDLKRIGAEIYGKSETDY